MDRGLSNKVGTLKGNQISFGSVYLDTPLPPSRGEFRCDSPFEGGRGVFLSLKANEIWLKAETRRNDKGESDWSNIIEFKG